MEIQIDFDLTEDLQQVVDNSDKASGLNAICKDIVEKSCAESSGASNSSSYDWSTISNQVVGYENY